MKLLIAKQHGAWAMVIIPFWLGALEGGLVWQHIPFFIGWILLYLATYPMLLLFKGKRMAFYIKWISFYLSGAILFLLVPLWKNPGILYFGLLMIPFFFINAFFSAKNHDRALLNDFSAIIAFSLSSLASSFLSSGSVSSQSFLIFGASVFFFTGCTFYVKTMIREKQNVYYKWISWIYHFSVPIFWFILGDWIVAIAYIPSLVRAIGLYGKTLSIKRLGIYEIMNAAVFFLMMAISLIIHK